MDNITLLNPQLLWLAAHRFKPQPHVLLPERCT